MVQQELALALLVVVVRSSEPFTVAAEELPEGMLAAGFGGTGALVTAIRNYSGLQQEPCAD